MTQTKPNPLRKTIISTLLGALAGFLGMMLLTTQVKRFDLADDVVIAGGAGMIYLLTGLFVLWGSLMPNAGAKLLNVEDADELRDMKKMLTGSSAILSFFGFALIALAFSAPGGPIPASIAFAILVASILVSAIVGWRQWDHYDEMYKRVSHEGANWAMCILLPIILIWGACAHFGWAAPIKPLSLIGVASFMVLVGSFIASGRRGMLKPR